jgi:hypothetical protein
MALIFRTSFRIIELSRWHPDAASGTRRTFSSVQAAQSFLRGCLSDTWDRQALRRFLSEEMSSRVVALTDHVVIDQMAQHLAYGRVHVIERPHEPLRFPNRSRGASEDAEGPPVQSPQTVLAWIRLRVIHARTGAPIPGIPLHVTLPDDTERDGTTDADGLVVYRDIQPGICMVTCDLQDARLRDTYAFAGLGEMPPPPGGDGTETTAPATEESPATRSRIAQIEAHKVKTGESLKSIAETHGMTWQELALFNWDTAEPDAINEHLYDEVGCTKKTSDGYNYVFDDADEPGLLYLPKLWEMTALVTEQTHTFRVREAEGFRIILENDDGLRIPEADYEATLADGSTRKGRLGRSGIALIEDPPPGPVEVVFPDLDDVEAKSLAVSARKGFEDREPQEIHRLFRYPPETVQRAFAAYDAYFNDYHGEGLRHDIEQEFFTDPDVHMVFYAHMARAHLIVDTAAETTEMER